MTKSPKANIILKVSKTQGYRQVGKARVSESRMRWFESSYPCHLKLHVAFTAAFFYTQKRKERVIVSNFKYILFDLDGTLIDSGAGIIKGVKYALRKYGIEEENEAQLRTFVGPPLNQQFAKCYGFSAEKSIEAVKFFREYYETKGILENEMYAGIDSVLQKLKAQGKFLMVATSKPEKFAHNILAQHDLEKYFDFIGGSLTDGSRITKIQVLDYVLKTNKIENTDEVLMIGDTKFDILGAKNFDLKSMAVTYGYGTEKELMEAKPDFTAGSPEEILWVIK